MALLMESLRISFISVNSEGDIIVCATLHRRPTNRDGKSQVITILWGPWTSNIPIKNLRYSIILSEIYFF